MLRDRPLGSAGLPTANPRLPAPRAPSRLSARTLLALLAAGTVLTACGSSADEPQQDVGARGGVTESPGGSVIAPTNPATAASRAGTEAACPVAASEISSLTSMAWTFKLHEADRPDEVDPKVRSSVCIFTSDEVNQDGDPAVLRTDEFTGAYAAGARAAFEKSCANAAGKVTPAARSGGVLCAFDGVASEGQVGDASRTVGLTLLADKSVEAKVSPSFDALLAAAN